jgi:hypothetical protein
MIARASHRIRAFVALVLFGTGGGGDQLLDALVFHSRPEQPDVIRMNAGDHCHAERCQLGVPIVTPPPHAPAVGDGRFEPPSHRTIAAAPLDAPRSAVVAGPLGSRAPPVRS